MKYFHIITLCAILFNCSNTSDDLFVEEVIEVPEEVVDDGITRINTLVDLQKYATKNNGYIKMAPGTYLIDDASYFKEFSVYSYSDTSDEIPDGTYAISALFHFSGNNNVFDLEGVIINVDTSIYSEVDSNRKIYELFINGDNNIIKGLDFNNLGDGYSAPYAVTSSAVMLTVSGKQNTLEDVSLYVAGSSPYGYGFHLGKGGEGDVDLHKHSSLLVTGTYIKLLRCNVITRGFGHGIVMQGAVDTHIEDCYVEGEMRNTNEILEETSGFAFDNDFTSEYAPGTIQPNQMIALSEDGIRTYADGPISYSNTNNVTVLNCTVKNMRGGYDLVAGNGEKIIDGSTAIGCQTQGFSGGSGITITNSKGDAQYGPLLSFWYTSGKNGVVSLELMNTESNYPPTRLAEINGSGHNITISNYENKVRVNPLPIVFGASFWGDTRTFRYPNEDPDTHAGASNVIMNNQTQMPIVLNHLSNSNTVTTNGTVTDDGEGNSIN